MKDLFKALWTTFWFAGMGAIWLAFFAFLDISVSMNSGEPMTNGQFIFLYLLTVFSASLYTTTLKDD